MTTMNVSLTEDLRSYVEGRVADEGYVSTSEYVRDLIRHDRDREALRELVVAGFESGSAGEMDDSFFELLNERIVQQ
jgi:antitoxin ParD1/3/4